jgi:hypothetical protein
VQYIGIYLEITSRVTIYHFKVQAGSKEALLGQICPRKDQNGLKQPKTAKNRLCVLVNISSKMY